MDKKIFFLLILGLVLTGFFGCKSLDEDIAKGLPVIIINSEKLPEEEFNNDFIKKPVSASVKEAKATWDEIDTSPDPYYKACTISVYDKTGKKCINQANAEVKVRGNWTTNYAKKGLRIKFNKDEKQNILGLNNGTKFRNWVLLASYKDWSFLRDITGHTIAKLISPDYYTTDSTLVEVYANDEYLGVYVLAEQQEVNKNRVNITDAEDNANTNVGYLIEYDSYYTTEDEDCVFEIDYNQYGAIVDRNGNQITMYNKGYTIKNDLNNVSQRNFIKDYMNNLWKLCYEAIYNNTFYKFDDSYNLVLADNITNPKDCISEYVDLQSVVDTYILHEIVCDPDIYLTSFYMDIDLNKNNPKKLTFEAPWDFDSTMGNKNHCADAEGFFVATIGKEVNYKETGTGNPWLMLFVGSDWFNQMVKEKWLQIKEQNVLEEVVAKINYFTNNYATSFKNNYKKWENIGNPELVGNELCQNSANCKTQREAATYLKTWLEKRFNNLDLLFEFEN